MDLFILLQCHLNYFVQSIYNRIIFSLTAGFDSINVAFSYIKINTGDNLTYKKLWRPIHVQKVKGSTTFNKLQKVQNHNKH